MDRRITDFLTIAIGAMIIILATGCNATKHVPEGKYLLRSNTIKLKTDVPLTQKGELRDNMERLASQKPNKYVLGIFPYKVYLYNTRYKKYQEDPTNFQLKSKTVEAPVIYDSTQKRRSALNMRSYMFNKGFFYAKVTDTTIYRGRKAHVTYTVETGGNYLINKVLFDIDDNTALDIITKAYTNTQLKTGTDFSYDLLELEKSRITNLMRDYGYYYFTNDNISFELDTMNKQYFKDIENPFESAINFIALQKNAKKPTLDIKLIVRADDSARQAYRRFGISRIRVFPDFKTNRDFRDTVNMLIKESQGVTFKYHNYYVRENVVRKQLFIEPGHYYSQSEYDQTLSKLNELGIFQSVRISYREDSTREGDWLSSSVILTPNDKLDYGTSWELSNATTYDAGTNLTLSFRNRNLWRGANLLSMSVTGGIESLYDSVGNGFFDHFKLLTKSIGFNASIDFPKFLFPIRQNKVSVNNAPRTVIGFGINLLDRVNFFTLINTNTSLQYRWKETKTKTWEISPAFVNIIRLPSISPQFQARLDSNEFLRNSYKPTFIEGENIAFTFSDRERKNGKNYNYIRISAEEAGGLMKGLNQLIPRFDSSYSQYMKYDLDAQRFFHRRHSLVGLRFQAGVGIPYDQSTTLPYIKQYFVGGAYSIRGYRIRTLGPGSYYDPTPVSASNIVDRIGDIKLEMTAEYRFDIVKLFSGAIQMNGALFADAGNIWLAQKAEKYPNGEFKFSRLGQDVAISTGTGIRFDIAGFFLVRLDAAFPIKKPAYFDNIAQPADYKFYGKSGWVINQVDPLYNEWWKREVVLNFAIGYPF